MNKIEHRYVNMLMKKKLSVRAFAIVKVASKLFDKIEPFIVVDWKKQKSWNHQISFKERFEKLKIFFYSFLFRILQTFRKKIALIKYGTFTAPLEVIKVCEIVKTSVDFRCQIHQRSTRAFFVQTLFRQLTCT